LFTFSYLKDGPLVSASDSASLEGNVNGPALIRCPHWVENPAARYLLYFAHHEGRSIRLALADRLEGPWRIHEPAALALSHSHFPVDSPPLENLAAEARGFIERGEDGNYPHIASPDAWVDHQIQQIQLYYHGRMENGLQRTRVAVSANGIDFTARPEVLATAYLRLFKHQDWFYAITMPAQLYRSRDGLQNFEAGPQLTDEPIRHHSLLQHQGHWYVFWTRVGDSPERILVSRLRTGADWHQWRMEPGVEVHRPQRGWEGADEPIQASSYGGVMQPVNQLRDPAIYRQDGRIYLLYAIAGEQGIGIGELTPD